MGSFGSSKRGSRVLRASCKVVSLLVDRWLFSLPHALGDCSGDGCFHGHRHLPRPAGNLSETGSCCVYPTGPGSALSVFGYVHGFESSSWRRKGLCYSVSSFTTFSNKLSVSYRVGGGGLPTGSWEGLEVWAKSSAWSLIGKNGQSQVQTLASPGKRLPWKLLPFFFLV